MPSYTRNNTIKVLSPALVQKAFEKTFSQWTKPDLRHAQPYQRRFALTVSEKTNADPLWVIDTIEGIASHEMGGTSIEFQAMNMMETAQTYLIIVGSCTQAKSKTYDVFDDIVFDLYPKTCDITEYTGQTHVLSSAESVGDVLAELDLYDNVLIFEDELMTKLDDFKKNSAGSQKSTNSLLQVWNSKGSKTKGKLTIIGSAQQANSINMLRNNTANGEAQRWRVSISAPRKLDVSSLYVKNGLTSDFNRKCKSFLLAIRSGCSSSPALQVEFSPVGEAELRYKSLIKMYVTYAMEDKESDKIDMECIMIGEAGVELLIEDMKAITGDETFDIIRGKLDIFSFINNVGLWQDTYEIDNIPKQIGFIRTLFTMTDDILEKFPAMEKFEYFKDGSLDIISADSAKATVGDNIFNFCQELANIASDTHTGQFAKSLCEKLHIQFLRGILRSHFTEHYLKKSFFGMSVEVSDMFAIKDGAVGWNVERIRTYYKFMQLLDINLCKLDKTYAKYEQDTLLSSHALGNLKNDTCDHPHKKFIIKVLKKIYSSDTITQRLATKNCIYGTKHKIDKNILIKYLQKLSELKLFTTDSSLHNNKELSIKYTKSDQFEALICNENSDVSKYLRQFNINPNDIDDQFIKQKSDNCGKADGRTSDNTDSTDTTSDPTPQTTDDHTPGTTDNAGDTESGGANGIDSTTTKSDNGDNNCENEEKLPLNSSAAIDPAAANLQGKRLTLDTGKEVYVVQYIPQNRVKKFKVKYIDSGLIRTIALKQGYIVQPFWYLQHPEAPICNTFFYRSFCKRGDVIIPVLVTGPASYRTNHFSVESLGEKIDFKQLGQREIKVPGFGRCVLETMLMIAIDESDSISSQYIDTSEWSTTDDVLKWFESWLFDYINRDETYMIDNYNTSKHESYTAELSTLTESEIKQTIAMLRTDSAPGDAIKALDSVLSELFLPAFAASGGIRLKSVFKINDAYFLIKHASDNYSAFMAHYSADALEAAIEKHTGYDGKHHNFFSNKSHCAQCKIIIPVETDSLDCARPGCESCICCPCAKTVADESVESVRNDIGVNNENVSFFCWGCVEAQTNVVLAKVP